MYRHKPLSLYLQLQLQYIIFGGAYRNRHAVYCLTQISKYITLKSTNSILNIT